eukprot:350817-Chlamydomonas_euryale.AAC.1
MTPNALPWMRLEAMTAPTARLAKAATAHYNMRAGNKTHAVPPPVHACCGICTPRKEREDLTCWGWPPICPRPAFCMRPCHTFEHASQSPPVQAASTMLMAARAVASRRFAGLAGSAACASPCVCRCVQAHFFTHGTNIDRTCCRVSNGAFWRCHGRHHGASTASQNPSTSLRHDPSAAWRTLRRCSSGLPDAPPACTASPLAKSLSPTAGTSPISAPAPGTAVPADTLHAVRAAPATPHAAAADNNNSSSSIPGRRSATKLRREARDRDRACGGRVFVRVDPPTVSGPSPLPGSMVRRASHMKGGRWPVTHQRGLFGLGAVTSERFKTQGVELD